MNQESRKTDRVLRLFVILRMGLRKRKLSPHRMFCAGPTGNIVGAGEKTVCGACGLITGANVLKNTVSLSESFPMSVRYWSGVDHVFFRQIGSAAEAIFIGRFESMPVRIPTSICMAVFDAVRQGT
ncbi:MAG TPA: hypothetical protein PLU75_06155 [Oscillospiraceae bacterium]|nr:hypothetical protein [Oscillospiraceae bacterium]HRW57681.1 hypothetical protein [Oscillospiraceae bacterium]